MRKNASDFVSVLLNKAEKMTVNRKHTCENGFTHTVKSTVRPTCFDVSALAAALNTDSAATVRTKIDDGTSVASTIHGKHVSGMIYGPPAKSKSRARKSRTVASPDAVPEVA